MVNHVIRVVADHPTIVDLAKDLAADTRRRWHLDRHVIVGAILIVVLILVIVVVVRGGGGGGHDGR
jgi:hypothetical protein